MSKENVKKFVMGAQEKSELRSILEKTKSGFDSKEARREYIATEAKKYGYNFTADELKTFLTEEATNLSDDDLENVAGGSWVGKGLIYLGKVVDWIL